LLIHSTNIYLASAPASEIELVTEGTETRKPTSFSFMELTGFWGRQVISRQSPYKFVSQVVVSALKEKKKKKLGPQKIVGVAFKDEEDCL